MAGGQNQNQLTLSSLLRLPGDLSFGSPPSPVDIEHWAIKAVASHIGGNAQTWTADDWQLAARYLARALEFSTARERPLPLHNFQATSPHVKRKRGSPPKNSLERFAASRRLSDLVNSVKPKPKRQRGRPPFPEEFWLSMYDLFTSARTNLSENIKGGRITDKEVITRVLTRYASSRNKPPRWVRAMVPRFQKLYSEAKKRVRKIRGNS
jgi:hypothetical protein